MQLQVLLLVLALTTIKAKSITNQNQCSDVIHLNDHFYVKEEIHNISGFPADISINFKTGNIYFTMISLQRDQTKMSIQNMRPNGVIRQVKLGGLNGLGQSTAVDNTNDIVYFATDNGVYKLGDPNPYTAVNEDIMYITVTKDGRTIYIATFPQNRVHKITDDGKKQEMYNSIIDGHGITVDGSNNIYFLAAKTAYVQQNGHDLSAKIAGLPQDGVIGFFIGAHGGVYTMDERSNLYVIDGEKAAAEKLGSFGVDNVNTFGLDRDGNVFIGKSKAILKFGAFNVNPCA